MHLTLFYKYKHTSTYCDMNEPLQTLPVTARTLETMIRLSVAHAKCRLSNEVQEVCVSGCFPI
jgi:DNA replicative helicase MCM subunit Mcm2 (Cdc46/Mcm family)